MSAVIVKGMEMPEKCGSCDLFHAESPMHCTVVKGHKTVGAPYGMLRPEWCPIIALSDKHGRLIDADALIDDLKTFFAGDYIADMVAERVEKMPTIVESEGET